MSAELQIDTATLEAVAMHALKQGLRTTCIKAQTGFSIDHLEAVPGSATVLPAPNAVDVRIMVDLFIVLDADLQAAPNATPTGATSPMVQVPIVLRLLMGANKASLPTLLELVPQPIDLSSPGSGLPDAVTQAAKDLQASLPSASIDLAPQLAPLGINNPSRSDVVLAGGVVAVRFDPVQAPQSHLFPGQSWGFFIDGPTVAQFVAGRVQPGIAKSSPDSAVSANYAPTGDIPHVDLAIDGSFEIALLSDSFTVHFPCDFSVVKAAVPVLRASVAWTVDVHGLDPFKVVQKAIEHKVSDDIDGFGGVQSGDRFFVLDTPLPGLSLLGSVLRFDTARGSQDGMTLGGGVSITGLLETPLTFSVNRLGTPAWIELCSKNAATGSGAPSREPPSLLNTTCYGSIDVSGYGAICGAEVQVPNDSLQHYVSLPPPAPESDTVRIGLAVPALLASAMTQPLRLVLRTPRGVRLIDLGLAPKAQADANGNLVNVLHIYTPDCPYLSGAFVGLAWGSLDLGALKPHASDGPDWEVYLQAQGGLITQLVTAARLEAGEILRFRSATHAIDVIADAQGRARIPVFLPLAPDMGAARLARANGRPLGADFRVQTAVFEYQATLRGAVRGMPQPTASGGLTVITQRGHRLSAFSVRNYGVQELEDLNPQPLPPREETASTRRELPECGIAGIEKLLLLPGFPRSGLAIAQTADRGMLLLEIDSTSGPRIAGVFAGPIGVMHQEGNWAIAAVGHDTAVFRYTAASAGCEC